MFSTLIQAEELHALLSSGEDVVVVDCRHDLLHPDAGLTLYAEGHIPGSVFAHMDNDLSGPHESVGDGRHPWPSAAKFHGTLQEWNVRTSTQVVAYDGSNGAFAARLWYLLRMLGHDAVAVLDGGLARWNSLGYPLATSLSDASPAPRASGGFHRNGFNESRLVDAVGVAKRLARGRLLIDSRAADRFAGMNETIDRVAGHVPGAVNRPFALNLADDGRFKSADELRAEFLSLLDGHAPSEVMVMCGSGVTAAHNLLAMQHAGLDGASLFKGSWSGWIENPSNPVISP